LQAVALEKPGTYAEPAISASRTPLNI